jgi:hypothetical protein
MRHAEQRRRSLQRFSGTALLLASFFVGAHAPTADAGPLNLGVVSYDDFIPSGPDGASGTALISISNFTGDFLLGPDFPSLTALTLLDSTLTLNIAGEEDATVLSLGPIGPGIFPVFPELSSAFAITSLTFSANLSTSSFVLEDGTTFLAGSSAVTLTLLPSFGASVLAPGDVGVLSVTPVPEPGTISLVVSGLIAFGVRSRMRRRSFGGRPSDQERPVDGD